MIRKAFIALLVIIGTSIDILGQNLVKNPSLEIFNNRIIDGWQIVAGTPDIASRHNEIPPKNLFFNPFIPSGDSRKLSSIAFGDICFCQGFNSEWSEVLQVELLERLKRNNKYEISLYVIKSSPMERALTEVSVSVSRKMLPKADFPFNYNIPYVPLKSSSHPKISSRQEWVKVKGTYIAEGREKFISIGNFAGANKDALANLTGHGQSMYYCYDNVSVIPLELIEPEEEITTPLPSPELVIKSDTIEETLFLEDANFGINDYKLQSMAFPILDQLIEFLKNHPSPKILISGHTDDIGKHEDNLKLSEKRAKAVKDYLVLNGIADERIKSQGFGETKPIENNQSEVGRAKNRRVEIKLIYD